MTHHDSPDPNLAEPEVADDATVAVEEPPPPPEPWTPERVAAWNRYLDRYVAGGVVLLVLFSAIHPIANSALWPRLKTGQLISRGGPVTADPFSYTMEGRPWVNIPWLFEVANWQVYDLVTTSTGKMFWGATALILLNAAILAAAAAVVMAIRHRGPGLWWVALCVMFALGGFVAPSASIGITPIVGGFSSIAGTPEVAPGVWGLLLLAVELLLIHRAVNQGRRGALYGLPVVFLIWANVDESFAFGLMILASWLLGALARGGRRREEGGGPGPGAPLILGVLAGSAAACLLNPSLYRVYPTAFRPYVEMVQNLAGTLKTPLTGDMISFFDRRSQAYFEEALGPGMAGLQVAFYLLIVAAGLGSFVLNRRRFSAGRFLAYVAASLLWAGLVRLAPWYGVVWAAVLGLNGQEWYHDRYGVEGRLGGGWKLWSDGGRALTIVAIFAFMAIGITGFAGVEQPFGFGVDDSQLAFEAADFLRRSEVEGRVLNLSVAHGDALIWADPRHKTYIDGRHGLFPDALRQELRELRTALRKDDRARWSEILDKYDANTIMIAPRLRVDNEVFRELIRNPLFVPFYDDGNAVLFGRVDRPSPDRDRFLGQRLDAERIVYREYDPLRNPERTPSPVNWMDQILRHRALEEPGPRVNAAMRWLGRIWSGDVAERPLEPADCYMAIREARSALARNPDDKFAYQILQAAYDNLSRAELAILQRARGATGPSGEPAPPITPRPSATQGPSPLDFFAPATPPETLPDAFQGVLNRYLNRMLQPPEAADEGTAQTPPSQFLYFRYRQQVASLNFAIQTTPPPQTPAARRDLAAMNLQLADLYLNNQAYDLARDRLQAAFQLVGPGEFQEEERQRREQQINQLTERIVAFQDELDQVAGVQQSPIQRAQIAIQNGFLGLAISELQSAEAQGVSLIQVRPLLVDLYCRIGQPDEAFTLLEQTNVNDPSLATGPGTGAYRQGLVYSLLGYYRDGNEVWQGYAVPELRRAQVFQALNGGARALVVGDAVAATRSILEVTGTPATEGYVETQAQWEFEIGLALLEFGVPQDIKDDRGQLLQPGAASRFVNALKLDPEIPTRPLILYYLEKLGVEAPPADAEGTPEPAPAEDASPGSRPSATAPDATASPGSPGPQPETEAP